MIGYDCIGAHTIGGPGSEGAVSMPEPGIEVTLPEKHLHFTLPEKHLDFTLEDSDA